jgi:hypothetical protein
MSGLVLGKPCGNAVISPNIKLTCSTLMVSNIFSLDSAHNFFQQLLLLPEDFTIPHLPVILTVFPHMELSLSRPAVQGRTWCISK